MSHNKPTNPLQKKPRGGNITKHGTIHRTMHKGQTSISGSLSMNTPQQADAPRLVGQLGFYNLRIQSMDTVMNHYGGHVDLTATVELKTYGEGSLGSDNVRQLEDLLKDLQLLNDIQESDQVPVQDLWNSLKMLMALTNETDK